jgi:protein-tyrosine phosphatase
MGRFGPRARAMKDDLIRKNWVHMIASDAHSIEGRPPAMGEAHRMLADEFGKEMADRLCVRNPGAVFRADPLAPQPEPSDLYDETKSMRRGSLRGIFGG